MLTAQERAPYTSMKPVLWQTGQEHMYPRGDHDFQGNHGCYQHICHDGREYG